MKGAKLELLAVMIGSLSLAACGAPEDEGRFDPNSAPGSTPWNHDTNVQCQSTADCSEGEACEDGVCQMARCLEAYESLAPMGPNHYFGTDGEMAVISDDSFVDAFESGGNGAYLSSWDLASMGAKVMDVAGGNLTGARPQTVAVALEQDDRVYVNGPGGIEPIEIGIWPKAIAAGDVDADGIDELIAFAEDGTIARCDVELGKCTAAKIADSAGKDVAVADVDGDGFEEAIFLLEHGGTTEIIVWNVDADITGQEATLGWSVSFPARALSAGDLNGDGVDELVLLEDGGWWNWVDDKLHVFSPAQDKIIASKNINGHTRDVAVGDRDSDDRDEIAVLREGQKLELLAMNDSLQISSLGTQDITVGQQATRISVVDWDGDSASGKLVKGPELVAGRSVPIAALMFAPFPYALAEEADGASVTLGNTESMGESLSDTLTLGVGLGVSFGGEYGIFEAKVGAFLDKEWSVTNTTAKYKSVGARYNVYAQPELHGTGYAPVVMSCGCYHKYSYVTEDPKGRIGGSGQTLELYVPVGGQTQVWSSKRYNSMAESTGLYPVIEIPIRVGDVASYPETKQALGGAPIAPEDMLFPEVPTYQVSDVGSASFWLVAGQTETNEVAESTTLGLTGSFGVAGVGVEGSVSAGVRQGYSINVGSDTMFAGSVPPVVDDPETPEDEYQVNRYSFSPFVYRNRYTDAWGEDAAYYVLHFAAAK